MAGLGPKLRNLIPKNFRILTLRLRLALISLFSLTILSVGGALLTGKIWIELSKTYGVLNLSQNIDNFQAHEKLEQLRAEISSAAPALPAAATPPNPSTPKVEDQGSFFQSKNFWAFREKLSTDDSNIEWLSQPLTIEQPLQAQFGKIVMEKIRRSRLREGSLEVDLPATFKTSDRTSYFVAFRQTQNKILVFGTSSHLDLWALSPWAIPFFGVFLAAYLLAALVAFLISGRLTRAYVQIANILESISAGRTQNLQMPYTSDPDIRQLTDAMGNMVKTLNSRDEQIAKVSKIALEDPMTGLPNYRAFEQNARLAFEQPPTDPGQVSVLVIVDLDFFKKVNDNHGHQVGDLVLRETAKVLKSCVRMVFDPSKPNRPLDFCARYGGEEFVLLLPVCSSEDAHVVAVRVMKSLRENVISVPAELSNTKAPYEMKVTASFGMAIKSPDEKFDTVEAWIKVSDESLYSAKERGRNRVVCLKPKLREWT